MELFKLFITYILDSFKYLFTFELGFAFTLLFLVLSVHLLVLRFFKS